MLEYSQHQTNDYYHYYSCYDGEWLVQTHSLSAAVLSPSACAMRRENQRMVLRTFFPILHLYALFFIFVLTCNALQKCLRGCVLLRVKCRSTWIACNARKISGSSFTFFLISADFLASFETVDNIIVPYWSQWRIAVMWESEWKWS